MDESGDILVGDITAGEHEIHEWSRSQMPEDSAIDVGAFQSDATKVGDASEGFGTIVGDGGVAEFEQDGMLRLRQGVTKRIERFVRGVGIGETEHQPKRPLFHRGDEFR